MPERLSAIRKVWEDAPDAQPVLQAALKLLASVYTLWMRSRADAYRKGRRPSHKLPCKVISVGNLSVGGTGKTPMVMYLARLLAARGLKIVIVSRGYRGRFEKTGGIVSDGRKILAGTVDSGDEPQILARRLPGTPVVVDGNRHRAGRRAVKVFAPHVILLDDAFQHLKLQRDLDLVLLDCRRPFGNGYTLPAGELREPVQALSRSDAVILTRCDHDTEPPAGKASGDALAGYPHGPVFRSRHVPVVREAIWPGDTTSTENALAGRRVFAFSGLAKNDEFLYTLSGLECEVAGSLGFPDHHFYSERDLAEVCRQAAGLGVDAVVTTEKDQVKIGPGIRWPAELRVLGIDLSFGDDEKRFEAFIEKQLNTCTD